VKSAAARPLHIVKPDEKRREAGPADLLAEIVPELAAAEAFVARLRQLLSEQGKRLAKERRVAFIREEHLRREFGNG